MNDNDRRLLTSAIIALDLIIKDCIERERLNRPPHEVARHVLEYVSGMLNGLDEMDHNHQQYIINVTEIAADIKRIFLQSAITDKDLEDMLKLQKVRLAWLGVDTEENNIRFHGNLH